MSGQTIVRAEAILMRATLENDARTLEHLIHPSFVYLGQRSGGARSWTRAQWLAALRQTRFQTLEHRVRDLQVFAASAVVTIEEACLADLNGTMHDERLLMTDVWVKSLADGWRLVRRHATRDVEHEPGAAVLAPSLELQLD